MDAVLLFFETKWAWYQSLDTATQVGIGLGVIGLPAPLVVYIAWFIKPFKRKKPVPPPPPAGPAPPDPGRPLGRDEVLRAVTEGTITLEVAKGIFALNRAETTPQNQAVIAPRTSSNRAMSKIPLNPEEGMASQLGIIAQMRGDLGAAQDYYQQALAINQDLGRKESMASDLGNLGNLAGMRGDINTAEDYYQKSLDILEDLGSKEGMASALGNLGIIAKTRGDLDTAQDYYQQALAIDQDLGRKEGMASDLGNLGFLAEARGDIAGAITLLQRAHALYAEIGALNGQGGQIVQDALARLKPPGD